MPEQRTFRGREVKNARRISINSQEVIRITFASRKGQPGQQIDVTPEEYDAGVTRTFKPGSGGQKTTSKGRQSR